MLMNGGATTIGNDTALLPELGSGWLPATEATTEFVPFAKGVTLIQTVAVPPLRIVPSFVKMLPLVEVELP